MAEYFVGPVMEKIIDTCFEYFKDQVKWKTEVNELKKLQLIHPQIQSLVSSYNQLENKFPALNKWYWKLRDAVDEADDVLDDLLEYRTKHKEQNILEQNIEISKNSVDNDDNLKRLKEAMHKLYEISAEVTAFCYLVKNIKKMKQQQQLEMSEMRETGSMPTDNLIGRSKEIEFVRLWLRNSCQKEIANTGFYSNISVLSVVGHGGMGKTTLLQHVFCDRMTEEFDVKIWVCVSPNFNAKRVISNMLKFLKKQVSDIEPLATLQSALQSEVIFKKYLLVLDDIWEEDEGKWKNVFAPLVYGCLGSKILITTRLNSVASKFAKMIKNSKEILVLNSLEEDECLKLFNTHAFAGVENPSDEFKSIGAKVIQKLLGCPLAAKFIGDILNDYMDEHNWKKILNTDIGSIHLDQNYLLPILKLSYIFLPKYLQNCFAFCCIFPQDHEFEKDDLVRMWIALGFIQSSDIQAETLEDIGRGYFNILVQKSFFDKFCTNATEMFYKMHGLVHELAQSVFTQECYKIVDNEDFPTLTETIRHLSITTHSSDGLKATFQKTKKLKKLHSLFIYFSDFFMAGENEISEILKTFKSIRLLVISCWNMLMMPEAIGCLIHLRYLKIECRSCHILSYDVQLPRSICHLYHLQYIFSKKLEIDNIGWKPCNNFIVDELFTKDPYLSHKCISSLRRLTIMGNDKLVSLPDLPSSLQYIELADLSSLQCLPSSLSTISSLKTLYLRNIKLLKSLPDLPYSLELLNLRDLDSLQCLPSCRSTNLDRLSINKVPRLFKLPELPSSLRMLQLRELVSLRWLPSSITTTNLKVLWIIKVPRLLELPELPTSFEDLCIEDCHPQLMEHYENFYDTDQSNE